MNSDIVTEPERVAGEETTTQDLPGGGQSVERYSVPGLGGFIVNNGYIKLHRKIEENPIVQKPVYAWLFVMLLVRARHDQGTINWNGEQLLLKKGQLITGRIELSRLICAPQSTIERALTWLENGHYIGQQKTTKYRLITILNWEKYQSADTKADNKRTSRGHQTDTNKNEQERIRMNKNVGVAVATTPSDDAVDFFGQGNKYAELRTLLVEKIPEAIVDRELSKFCLYWTEPNKSGTKVRWQLQQTFDVKRRLRTWLENIKSNKPSKGKQIV